ncbi:phage tail sheath family protein [Thalassomonas viridans]|uniref:Phage tail sheath family protein n=1 Tax=Thalassomonas viridans TaxID=137584 RepID=A0AAE9Z081_9GAMM|nr:phage tail sheath C-terminal domain-containing protein [Thalassomonas viridans]WDE03649.1 phage tail sheath family protein [Thalassomonas viridans]
MATYLHPGVYLEELPSGSRPIEAVGTSTACFIGYTVKGPMDTPTLITSWNEYDSQFGGLQETETAVAGAAVPLGDPMGFSVYAFFQNGGSTAYIIRSAQGANAATGELGASLVTFTAVNDGDAGNDIVVRITEDGGTFDVEVGTGTGGGFSADETISNVTFTAGADFIETRVASESSIVTVSVADATAAAAEFGAGETEEITFNGGLDGAAAATGSLVSGTPLVTFTAINEGTWGDDLVVTISESNGDYTVAVGQGTGTDFEAQEEFEDVSLTDTDPNYLPNKINDISELVTVEVNDLAGLVTEVATDNTEEVTFSGGNNGSAPGLTEYTPIFNQLLKVRDINMLLLPGLYWDMTDAGAKQAIINAGIAHCETIKNRMILVDPQPGDELDNGNEVKALSLPTQTYVAAYYPWVVVSNPAYDVDLNPGASQKLLAAPSGFAAGLWAKTDGRRGVWKAPAGVESALLGVAELEYKVEDPEQDYLNPLGINAIRKIPGYGPVVWGSRTRATKSNPEWRYVPVRRTAMFIEESLYNGIQWAVFEPNDHRLWSSLRINIESFMNGLFRAGAFQGEKASDAYFVRCGLGDTMTQGDIDRGQVIAIVGFAPLKPAEFVIVRLQQIVGQQ